MILVNNELSASLDRWFKRDKYIWIVTENYKPVTIEKYNAAANLENFQKFIAE